MTGKADWKPDMEDALSGGDQQEPGIWDVHSPSSLEGSDGTV